VTHRDDGQAQPAEVLVEREARDVLEQCRHHDKRDRVAEREAVIATVPAEDLFRLDANIRTIVRDMRRTSLA